MGNAASLLLPQEPMDQETARALFGDKFDEALFDELKDPVTGEQTVEPDEEIAARFAALAELVGPEKAFTIVKNSDGRVISMEPELVKGYVDAWIERAGERALALEILCKNPNLIAGDVNEIKNAPVQVALAIANGIDFTRKFSGG